MSFFRRIWNFLKELFGLSTTPTPNPTPPTPTPPAPPTPIQVWWINQSQGSLSDADATRIVEALNIQVPHLEMFWSDHLTPITHTLLPTGQTPPNASQSVIKAYWLPNADVAGALGYHDVDPQGDPYIRVFIDTITQNGGSILSGALSVSVCSSHEACEEAVDPPCTDTATAPNGDVWALEVGDPVESNSYNVTVADGTNVAVSDFVTPAFFELANPAGQDPKQYDYDKAATAPFTLISGGYAVINNKQVFGDKYPEFRKADKAFPVARTSRRLNASRNRAV